MIFPKKTAASPSALAEALDLSRAPDEAVAEINYFDQLSTELRVSKAVFHPDEGLLRVNGWCLTPEEEFDLFLDLPGTSLVARITPNTEPRPDVFQTYVQYGNKTSGWSIEVKVPDLPAGTVARVSYLSDARRRIFEKPVTRKEAPAAPAAQEGFKIKTCVYSPMRSLVTILGELTTDRDDLAFAVTLSDGTEVTNLRAAVSPGNARGLRNIRLNFVTSGVRSKEVVTVTETGNPANTVTLPLEIGKDSPNRRIATTPSVLQDLAAAAGSLTLEDLQPLRQALVGAAAVEKEPGAVCYFPAFDAVDPQADHMHRASWYLTGTGSPVRRVTFAGPADTATLPAAPEHFATRNMTMESFELLAAEDPAYLEALRRAETLLVWRPLPKGMQDYLSGLLDHPRLITVATEDPAAVEYGNYCRAPWEMLAEADRQALLQESQERFRRVLQDQRAAGKTCSTVFGTGPSIDQAFDFDFSDCMTVACNSIVANDALLDHIRPAFLCAGDAVSHFGIAQYAETFRADLIRAIQTRGIHFLTSATIGYLLIQKHPEIRDHVILCEQGITGLNSDLSHVWSLPKFDSTLNIHMLPIAASFSDTIYMLGLDGRDPNPANNEDFWAHSKAAQYHDLVDSGHLAHPTFTLNRARATEDRYIASVQESLMAGEALGKSFYALAPSFTPAIHARPVQPHCFAATGAEARRKLRAVPRPADLPATARSGKRALIVTQITRRYFSGGRYHGTMLAEALAGFCDEVVVWTNNMPPWSGDLAACPDHGKVHYWINDFVEAPTGTFDYVIMLPDGAQDPYVYCKALDIARSTAARSIFINFESPNWFNALSPQPKVLAEMDNWFAAGAFCDIILSSAQTAVPFAESYYQTPFHRPSFAVAPPAINSPIADLVRQQNLPKEKQIILISRFGNISAHKNINAIFDCITPEMAGYTLALIAGTAPLPDPETLEAFTARLDKAGMSLKLLYMISDREKYEEIAKSELMIFPSLFEGFGYPPVEAGYMGTPCVAYDLPVLQEFNDDHAHLVPWGDAEALRSKISDLLRLPLPERLRTATPAVLKTATLAAFSRTLQEILTKAPEASAAARFTPEKFELVRRVYLDGISEPELSCGGLSGAELQALAGRYARYSRIAAEALEKRMALPASAAPGEPS